MGSQTEKWEVEGAVAALESIIAEVLAEVNEKMEKAGFRIPEAKQGVTWSRKDSR